MSVLNSIRGSKNNKIILNQSNISKNVTSCEGHKSHNIMGPNINYES